MSTTEVRIYPTTTRALIFDLDGTIVDNMAFHNQAWQELLKKLGFEWSVEEIKERVWGKNEEIFERLFPGRFSVQEARELSLEKELRYIECYRPHIRMIHGLQNLFEAASAAALRLAVATAAPRVCVDFVFQALDLLRYIDVLVQADDVRLSKPHPETFLTAAERLGVSPSECLVFEDAPVGVRAAEAAGMESYVLLTTHGKDEFANFRSVRGFLSDYASVQVVPA